MPLGRPNPKPQFQLWPPVAQTSSTIYTKEPGRVPLPHNQAPTSLRGLCNDRARSGLPVILGSRKHQALFAH